MSIQAKLSLENGWIFVAWLRGLIICHGCVVNPICWNFVSIGHNYLCYLPERNKLGGGAINSNLKLDHKSFPKQPSPPLSWMCFCNVQPKGSNHWRRSISPGQVLARQLRFLSYSTLSLLHSGLFYYCSWLLIILEVSFVSAKRTFHLLSGSYNPK